MTGFAPYFRRFTLAGLVAALLVLAAPVSAIEIKEVKSPGGLTAWLVEDHTNPIINISLAFRGGAALDPVGKEGLASLVSSTLDEGAGDMDSQAFQRTLEDLAISLSFDAGRDSFTGSVRTLTENRDAAFDLLRLALTKPRFDPPAVERIRGQIMANLRRESENPNRIAGQVLFENLYPGHPYGRPAEGTLETVPLIKIADLHLFVAQRFAKDNLVVGVVGDITPGELAAALDLMFGALPAKASDWRLPEIAADGANRTVLVEKPLPQSVIRFGQRGVKRDDPDFFAAFIMNYVLGGGGFESRIYEEVREKRGLAYSAFSFLSPMDHSGVIVAGADTENSRAAETVEIMKAEWKRMAERGLTADELKDAKTFLTGSYALRFSSSGRIASILVGLQMENLGIDYIDRRNGLIESVTLEEVNRVAKKLLQPDNLTLVIVGNPPNFKSQP